MVLNNNSDPVAGKAAIKPASKSPARYVRAATSLRRVIAREGVLARLEGSA
jgi:hypothetical protein